MLGHILSTPASPTRVVVLGGSGFIGSHLLAGLNATKTASVSVSSTTIDLVRPDAPSALVDQVRPEDTLVFISCLTADKGNDPSTLMKNLAMAEHVARFLERQGCSHVIYLSTDAVYKDDITLISEDSECNPTGMYGLAHVVRERMVEFSCQKAGIPLAILRPCAVYGAGDTHNGYGPNRFLRTALDEGKVLLFGHGEEKRDHVFVEDVCRFIVECATYRSTGTLNLATGDAHSFAQVAEIVAQVVGRSVEIVPSPRRMPVTHRHFNVTAALKTFPAITCTPLEQGLRRVVQARMAETG